MVFENALDRIRAHQQSLKRAFRKAGAKENILYGERATTVGHQMNREILRLRPDVNAVIHLHHDETIAFFAAGFEKLNITGLTFPYLMQSYPHYLPAHIDVNNVINTISPDKDVDCFTPGSVGRLWRPAKAS